ncbi:MAG: S26 family signal peptidase [Marinilabiliaceae bacterium]|nr:S26 family signal peptidase [Marinilabiliaceae bacterium]
MDIKENIQKASYWSWGKCILAAITLVLMTIWIGNWWLLLGLPIIFDMYISHIVPWNFWKKTKNGDKPAAWIEWADAIVFALIAVYFLNIFFFQNYQIPTSSLEKSMLVGDHLLVSKASYGPRIPNRPIFFPLTQNTLPVLNCKSYLDWPKWGYKRLKGLKEVEKGDIVVFNFPAGDTVCVAMSNPDYYTLLLSQGSQQISRNPQLLNGVKLSNSWERNHFIMDLGRKAMANPENPLSDIISRPVDKRDCYVKRCVATPGDTLELRHNELYINGVKQETPKGVQHIYEIKTTGVLLNDKFFETYGISKADRADGGIGPTYHLPLTAEKAKQIEQLPIIAEMHQLDEPPSNDGFSVYPFSSDYAWSRDNYGPLWIPKKGTTVTLDSANIMLYERIITAYEGHTLEMNNEGKIFVDGIETYEYTFAMDYYWMMGDNRHKSADSRYWGFVPEDHIVGTPLVVWLSLDPDKSFLSSIRWKRFFCTDF